MDHRLGRIAFSMPDDWRDVTSYRYTARSGDASLQVELATEADDAQSVLAAGRAAYEAYLKPQIVYSRETSVTAQGGVVVPAVEGEQRDQVPPTRSRFAMAPLVSGSRRALLTFVGPPDRDFLVRFEAIVAAVRYEGDAGSLPAAPAGMTHRQASFVHLPVPRAWEWPETLRFLDPEWDSVAVRVSIAEPLVPEGTLALGVEAPGRLCIVSSSTQPVDDVGARGWTGDWRVERPGADAGVLVVRKACLRLDPDVVVTLYGKARADLLERLDPVWAAVRASLRARGAG